MSSEQKYPWPDLSSFGVELQATKNPSTHCKSIGFVVKDMAAFFASTPYVPLIERTIAGLRLKEGLKNDLTTPIAIDENSTLADRVESFKAYATRYTPATVFADAVAEFRKEGYRIGVENDRNVIHTTNLQDGLASAIKKMFPAYDESLHVKDVLLSEVRTQPHQASDDFYQLVAQETRIDPFEPQSKLKLYVVSDESQAVSNQQLSLSPRQFGTLSELSPEETISGVLQSDGFNAMFAAPIANVRGGITSPFSGGLVYGYSDEKAAIASGLPYVERELPHGMVTHYKREKNGWLYAAIEDGRYLMTEDQETQLRNNMEDHAELHDKLPDNIKPFVTRTDPYSTVSANAAVIAFATRAYTDIAIKISELAGNDAPEDHAKYLKQINDHARWFDNTAWLQSYKGDTDAVERYKKNFTIEQLQEICDAAKTIAPVVEFMQQEIPFQRINSVMEELSVPIGYQTKLALAAYGVQLESYSPIEAIIDLKPARYERVIEKLQLFETALAQMQEERAAVQALIDKGGAAQVLSGLLANYQGPSSAERKDSGEILHGAHKHKHKGRIESLEDVKGAHVSDLMKAAKLSAIWPDDPDINKKLADGVSPTVLLRIRAIQEQIPSSFRLGGYNTDRRSHNHHKEKIDSNDRYATEVANDYIQVVCDLRDAISNALTEQEFNHGIYMFASRYDLERAIELPPDDESRIKHGKQEAVHGSSPLYSEHPRVNELHNALGRKIFTQYGLPVITAKLSGEFENPPAPYQRNFRIDARNGIAKSIQKIVEAMPTNTLTEEFMLKIRHNIRDPLRVVEEKTDNELAPLFLKAVARYCGVKIDALDIEKKGNDADSTNESEPVKKEKAPRVTRPHLDRLEFTRDWLNGLHADENLFESAYGVRGIQYGNWLLGKTTDSEAQQVLNTAFNAMADQADVLKVPPQVLSCGGYLGMAFASRGKKGAAAHYEAGSSKVINLTRYQGGGALSHELGHAFSHLIARVGGASDTRGLGHQLDNYKSGWEPLAKDLANFIEHLKSSEYNYFKRSKQVDEYEQRKKPYWSTPEEMFARFFEAYTEYKLNQSGLKSDYLVHSTQDGRGYPTSEELQSMSEKFDKYLDTHRMKIIELGMPPKLIKAHANDNTQSYGYEN